MSIYDRWHTADPRIDEDGKPVARCRGHKQYPSKDHGKGDRWQVRWRDESGRQCKRNFPKKSGTNPNTCAEAFDAKVKNDLDRGEYVDPQAGKIKLRAYGEGWLADQPFDNESTREATELRLRLHVFEDLIGDKELRNIKPSTIRAWVKRKKATLAPGYVRTIYANLSAVLAAAVDDGRIPKNPMRADSVKPPALEQRRVEAWPTAHVTAVRSSASERYRATVDVGGGLGMRQGEVFGLAVADVDFLRGVVHIRRQVKIVGARLVFAPPKGDKERDVPLPESIAIRLAAHIAAYPPIDVTLPWKKPDGKPVTARLIFTSRERKAINRNYFNTYIWKPALVAADVEPTRDNGFHALRHHFASVCLADGVDIRTLAEYLGHSDPGFTLRTYTHMLPAGADRMRRAIDRAFARLEIDGPSAAEGALDVP